MIFPLDFSRHLDYICGNQEERYGKDTQPQLPHVAT
jgi:hypothetical protein